jgi:ribosomal protein S18 acetylase RimI-like enzyme
MATVFQSQDISRVRIRDFAVVRRLAVLAERSGQSVGKAIDDLARISCAAVPSVIFSMPTVRWRVQTLRFVGLVVSWTHSIPLAHPAVLGFRYRCQALKATSSSASVEPYGAEVVLKQMRTRRYAERSPAPRVRTGDFFVARDKRCGGIGRECVKILFSQVWPKDKRITVDVLCQNEGAIAFWRAIGFTDYCLALEIYPDLRTKIPMGQS